MTEVGLGTPIGALGDLWLEARCPCGCVTQFPSRYLENEGLARVLIGDWADGLACNECGGAELEVLVWNGVLDLGYGSAKPERTMLLLAGEGAC